MAPPPPIGGARGVCSPLLTGRRMRRSPQVQDHPARCHRPHDTRCRQARRGTLRERYTDAAPGSRLSRCRQDRCRGCRTPGMPSPAPSPAWRRARPWRCATPTPPGVALTRLHPQPRRWGAPLGRPREPVGTVDPPPVGSRTGARTLGGGFPAELFRWFCRNFYLRRFEVSSSSLSNRAS